MALEQVFTKRLTETDINHRLSFPLEKLSILPPVANERDPVEFLVSCGGREYTFCCIKRPRGLYLKPVIERGWSAVVRNYNLQPRDLLEFYYLGASDHEGAHYQIGVQRWVLDHEDEMGTTWKWQRII